MDAEREAGTGKGPGTGSFPPLRLEEIIPVNERTEHTTDGKKIKTKIKQRLSSLP